MDIKPYFPCEEQPDGYEKEPELKEEDLTPLIFRGGPIGKYFNSHDCGIIKFHESEDLSDEAIEGAVRHIKEGYLLKKGWRAKS